MAWNGFNNNNPNHASVPFWDFIQSLDPNQQHHDDNVGAGVDRAAPPPGFPFGPGPYAFHGHGPWGPPWFRHGEGFGFGPGHRGGGRRGRHGRHGSSPPPPPPPPGEEQPPAFSDADLAARAAAEENEKAPVNEKTALLEKDDTPGTVRASPGAADDNDDPPEVPPEDGDDSPCGGRRRHCGGHGRRGRGPWGRGGFGHHHHHHGPHGHHHGPPPPPGHHGPHDHPPPPPPPYGAGMPPFDFRAMMAAFANHPFAQQLRAYAEQARTAARGFQQQRGGATNADGNNNGGDESDGFVPPVDIFATESGWTVHVALPGARKEDVGVHWDADRSELGVSGVVHRPGDEQFLAGMVSGERRIGLFQRSVRLPPPQQQQQQQQQQGPADAEGFGAEEVVDEEGISARMEDGILVINVPKVEREWTEVRKVDIE